MFFFLAYFTLYNWLQFHPSHQNWFKWILSTPSLFSYLLLWNSFNYFSIVIILQKHPVQFSSVYQTCLTLWNPMDGSKSGFLVHHQLLEPDLTHVHWDSDAIQPSHPLMSPSLLPSTFSSIRVFSNESALHIRWPIYWSFSFSQGWFPLGLSGLISLLDRGLSRVFSSTTNWKHQFFSTQLFLWSNSHIHTWLPEKP